MTEEQRETIERNIREYPDGDTMTLANLLGEKWDAVGSDTAKRQFGKDFIEAVRSGRILGLRFVRRNSANHAIYERI